MSCRKQKDRLSAYLDGELSGQQAAELEAHLSVCRACGRRLSLLRAAQAAVDRLPRARASEGFDAALRLKLQQARAGQPGRRAEESVPWWRSLGRLPLIATACAGACAAGLLALVALRGPGPAGAPAAQEPAAAVQLDVAEHMDMLQDYALLADLDVLEDFDVVSDLDSLTEAAP